MIEVCSLLLFQMSLLRNSYCFLLTNANDLSTFSLVQTLYSFPSRAGADAGTQKSPLPPAHCVPWWHRPKGRGLGLALWELMVPGGFQGPTRSPDSSALRHSWGGAFWIPSEPSSPRAHQVHCLVSNLRAAQGPAWATQTQGGVGAEPRFWMSTGWGF